MIRPTSSPSSPPRGVLLPLALAQFICSFAGSNMNVMITDISEDLDTTVHGVQLTITLFLLVMAALMIPGGKLTDRYGRKRCFIGGLAVYGAGALISALAPSLGVLMLGNSILEGIGTAMLIPPVYILATLLFTESNSRARAFGAIMAMGGIGAAAGPLIGGLITSAISWRAAFGFQALVIVVIIVSSRRILAADDNLWLMLALLAAGAVTLTLFFATVRAAERAGREPLLSTRLFRNRTANLGLITQNIQWLVLMGTSFVVSAYLQVVRGYNAIHTGVIFTAATVGLLLTSLSAAWLARHHTRRTLIMTGFTLTITGIAVLLALAGRTINPWGFAPGLLLIGLGLGAMLTPSVDIVQSAFDEQLQGEISGLSRSVSNLGSSLGTAIAGTILVAGLTSHAYAAAMITLALLAALGLGVTAALPRTPNPATATTSSGD